MNSNDEEIKITSYLLQNFTRISKAETPRPPQAEIKKKKLLCSVVTVREKMTVPPFQDSTSYWCLSVVTPAPWASHISWWFWCCLLCLKQGFPPFTGWGTDNLSSVTGIIPLLPETTPPRKREQREKSSEKLVWLLIGFFVLLLLLTITPPIG